MTDDKNTDSKRPPIHEERKLSPMRRTIANRLQESAQNAPHVTVSREMDAEALFTAKNTLEEQSEQDISLVDVLLGIFSETLSEHPEFNATFEENIHRSYESQHIAVAVDTEMGLVTPVIRSVETLSIPEIAAERRRLVELVQEREHTMSDLQGSTVTVTNLGVFGTDSFTPVINPPEVAIFGINRIRERAIPADDGVAFRRQIGIDLTFDHRPVDGADAARVLETFERKLTNADSFLDAPGE